MTDIQEPTMTDIQEPTMTDIQEPTMTDINANRDDIALAIARTAALAIARTAALAASPMQPVNGAVDLMHDVNVTVNGVVWSISLLGAIAIDVRKADPAQG
jgi:hypothetical protein